MDRYVNPVRGARATHGDDRSRHSTPTSLSPDEGGSLVSIQVDWDPARSGGTLTSASVSRGLRHRGTDVRLFGPFRLDVGDERLWKDGTELKLRRKPFAILKYLAMHPRRLVTQEELVEAVWGKVAMSASLLRTNIAELRRVLGHGDIETVAGRGYRFLLDVETEEPASNQLGHATTPPIATKLVGRHEEIGILQHVFEGALDGLRKMVFITGDPGIGKTALIDAFVAEIAAPCGSLIARGSCLEQFGRGEAYLPVLAALGALCRGPGGDRVIDLLGRHAPTWLAQMPGLVRDEYLQTLHLRVQGGTQARMLRELAEALDVIAAEKPLVFVLEDMHLCDHWTTDLVALLGARREQANIVVVVTCRPAELTKGQGLAKVIGELRAHKQGHTLHLEPWLERSVGHYLAQRFPDSRFPEALAATLHSMTGGNPLFTIAVIDDLETSHMIRRVDVGWQLEVNVAEVASRRPDTVRQLLDIQLDRLPPIEQRILEAAGLVGVQFAAGAVAHALELLVDEVDSVCERLANERRFLRFVGLEAWPDGTIQPHYEFVHALYRDAAVSRMPSATKRIRCQRVAEALVAAFGSTSRKMVDDLLWWTSALKAARARLLG